MAIAAEPDVLIADEPTTAVDVTTEALILELLAHLSDELGLAVLLITHDLAVAADFCDEISVMYAGRVVEHAPVGKMFADPQHPYTRALLNSTVTLDLDPDHPIPAIGGQSPLPGELPGGCPPCPAAIPGWATHVPPTVMTEQERLVECVHYSAGGEWLAP